MAERTKLAELADVSSIPGSVRIVDAQGVVHDYENEQVAQDEWKDLIGRLEYRQWTFVDKASILDADGKLGRPGEQVGRTFLSSLAGVRRLLGTVRVTNARGVLREFPDEMSAAEATKDRKDRLEFRDGEFFERPETESDLAAAQSGPSVAVDQTGEERQKALQARQNRERIERDRLERLGPHRSPDRPPV